MDAFVRAYAADGGRRWTRQFGSRGNDSAFGVAVDLEGNLYVVGYALGRLPGERYRGNGDAFIRKISHPGGSRGRASSGPGARILRLRWPRVPAGRS